MSSADTQRVTARANSAAELNRSAGTRASACRMAWSRDAGMAGRTRRTGAGSPVRRLAMIAWGVGPVNGGSPESIS